MSNKKGSAPPRYDEEFKKDTNEYPYQVINDKESIEKILKLYKEIEKLLKQNK